MASVPPGMVRNHNLQLQNEYPVKFTLFSLKSTITNVLLGAVAMSAMAYANSTASRHPDYVKSHIYLCVFGYVVLMPQAILSMNIRSGWARGLSCNNKRSVHLILQIAGSILGLAGCVNMMSMQSRRFYRNMSVHSILGLIAMTFTLLSLIGGLVNFTRKNIINNLSKTIHTTLGCSTIAFAFLALMWPEKKYMNMKRYSIEDDLLFICFGVICVILIIVSPIMNAREKLTKTQVSS